jgi:deoxyribonuclease-4
MRFIGAHIKKQTSVVNTLKTLEKEGGNVAQIFVSNPRSVQGGNIQKYKEESKDIRDFCKDKKMKIVIHAPYTINLARELKDGKRIQDIEDCYCAKVLINNLEISDIINSIGVVFHVGKHTTNTKERGEQNMYNSLKFIISKMKEKQIQSKLILETPAGAGTELLTNYTEFIDFYDKFTNDEKQYLKICLDTAHIWSAGCDINEYYFNIKSIIKDVIVIHLNNSKKNKGSKVDVHETIFEGKMETETIRTFIKNLKHNPVIVLEKPSDNIDKEILWIQDI